MLQFKTVEKKIALNFVSFSKKLFTNSNMWKIFKQSWEVYENLKISLNKSLNISDIL